MNVALGPALLFINDKAFTDADIERIQYIGDGGKVRDASRTGRFGQGFNTCYNVTDHPSLLTGDYVVWFDPHHHVFSEEGNASAWYLSEVESYYPAWFKTFSPAALEPGEKTFPGTVFRLPLRTSEKAGQSEILPEAFTDDNFESILQEIHKVGPALIVFLRSITRLEIFEIAPNGDRSLRFEISTINEEEVDRHKSKLRKFVEGHPKALLEQWIASPIQLPVTQYNHAFQLVDNDGKRRKETWAVTSGLFRGPNNELLLSALDVCQHEEKAIPWASAAIPITSTSKPQQAGGLACFLPVPEKNVIWPVWLNGWFDLSSNRRGITRSHDVGETTSSRYEWNRLLMEFAVGKAWALLVQHSKGNVETNTTPYALWPQSLSTHDEIDKSLITGFYNSVLELPVIRARTNEGYVWSTADKSLRDIPSMWLDRLSSPLLAEGCSICAPSLPSYSEEWFHHNKRPWPKVTPAKLRGDICSNGNPQDIACKLEAAPRKMLSQTDWVCSLAEYCANGDWNNLSGLPLALLADKLLHTFTMCGPLYLTTTEEAKLLEKLPERTLDASFRKVIGLDIPASRILLKHLDLGGLLDCIPNVLSVGKVDPDWLCNLFSYLSFQPAAAMQVHGVRLKTFKLIPDQNGSLRTMGSAYTPLMVSNGHSEELQFGLTRLGIPLASGHNNLRQALERFASNHKRFVWALTPSNLASCLISHTNTGSLNEDVLDDQSLLTPLLNFLASSDWLTEDDARLESLRKMRLLPTSCGQRVAASELDVYIPGGFQPPSRIDGKYRLLDTGPTEQWRRFFEALQVSTLEGHIFVERILIPAFADADKKQTHDYLVWLRDEYRKIESTLSDRNRQRLRDKLRNSDILPLNGGGLAAPCRVYFPKSKEPTSLLGSIARFPDEEFFADQSDLWFQFFSDHKLPTKPLAPDLYSAVAEVVRKSESSGALSVHKPLRKLLNHIRDQWPSIAQGKVRAGVTLAQGLSQLAWLPEAASKRARYAACKDWPDKLWRADELVTPKHGHLIASKYPIIDTPELPKEMGKALGLKYTLFLHEVFEHFSSVISLPADDDGSREAICRAANEFYGQIGDHENTPDNLPHKDLPSVLAGDEWRHPDRCFLEPLPFNTSWVASLSNTELNIQQPNVRLGLVRLGVRHSPASNDWLLMLKNLADKFAGRKLPSDVQNQARYALRLLRSAPSDWLSENDVYVLLSNETLENAKFSLIPDDPRLKSIGCKFELPLVEENEDVIDIAQRAGAKSFKGIITDRLKTRPTESKDVKARRFADQVTQNLRSKQFHKCLQRLAYQVAISSGDRNPTEVAEGARLELLKRLQIRMTTAIQIESVLDIRGNEIVAFETRASSYLDMTTSCIWLHYYESTNKMLRELVRTLCELFNVDDPLTLLGVMEVAPEQMSAVLDEEEIASLPEGQKFTLEANIGDSSENDLEIDSSDADVFDEINIENFDQSFKEDPNELDLQYAHDFEPLDDHREYADANLQSSEGLKPHRQNKSRPILTLNKGTTGPRSRNIEDIQEHKEAPIGDSQRRTKQTPSTSGDCSSRTGEERGQPAPSHRISGAKSSPSSGLIQSATQERMRSYVYSGDETSEEAERNDPRARKIGDAGEVIALNWELHQNRSAKLMPPNNEGYDIESGSEGNIRYIEVKSLDGAWGNRGVGVSRAQFEAALHKGEGWWLYVVEHALDPSNALVHRFQNPFFRVDEYRFDAGWLQVLEEKEEIE